MGRAARVDRGSQVGLLGELKKGLAERALNAEMERLGAVLDPSHSSPRIIRPLRFLPTCDSATLNGTPHPPIPTVAVGILRRVLLGDMSLHDIFKGTPTRLGQVEERKCLTVRTLGTDPNGHIQTSRSVIWVTEG